MQQIFLDTPLDYEIRSNDIETRLRSVEERLRSLEQPVWKIVSAELWHQCSNGGSGCQCDESTKAISCWRNSLKFLPPSQMIPNDVKDM